MVSASAPKEKVDYYMVLGIPSTATDEEIRKAYRKLALKFHPDKQKPGSDPKLSHEAFTRLQNAYETLREPSTRKKYDYQTRQKKDSQDSSKTTKNSNESTRRTAAGGDSSNTARNPSSSGFGDEFKKSTSSSSRPPSPKSSSKRNESSDPFNGFSSSWKYQQQQKSYSSSHSQSQQQEWWSSGNSQQENWQPGRTSGYQNRQSRDYDSNCQKPRASRKSATTGQADSASNPFGYQSGGGNTQHSHSRHGQPRQTKYDYTYYGHDFYSNNNGYNSFAKEETRKSGTKSSRNSRKSTPSREVPRTTFGVTLNGDYCKNCIKQRKYCWQHAYQDPENESAEDHCYKNVKSNTTHEARRTKPKSTKSSMNHCQTYYGITLSGKACKRCIQLGGYCHQHQSQAHGPKRAPTQPIFGVTKSGQPCKRCICQGQHCYQHRYQQ